MIKSTKKLVRSLFLMIFMVVFSLSTVGFQVNAQESETVEKLLGEKVLDDLSEGTVTRVVFVKMINTVFGFNEKSTVTFDDCEEGTWYDEEVRKAVAAGYIYGYGDGSFRPDQAITAEEAVTLIYRVFEPTTSKEVKRVETTSSWSQEAFSMLLHRDFIDRSLVLESKDTLGKAEALKMLEKAAGNVLTVAKTKKSVIKGNVVINKPIKSLRNVTIENDLYITAEALSKDLKLSNVKVKGKVHIIGGDGSTKSFIMENSQTSELKVDKKVSVALAKKSKVEEVQLNRETVLLTSKDTSIEKVVTNSKKAEIRAEGKIKNLVLKENATVNGKDVNKGQMVKVDSGSYKEKDSSYKKLIKTESKAIASSGSSSSSSSSRGTTTPVTPEPKPEVPEKPVTPEPKPEVPEKPVTPEPEPTPVTPEPVAPVAPTPVTDAEIGISLVGPNPMTILKDAPYVEPGYTATYTEGNRSVGLKTTDVTSKVVIKPQPVKTTTVGVWTIKYSVKYKGKSNEVTRSLKVVKELPTPDPDTETTKDLSIRLKGNSYMSLCIEDGFVDPGVIAIYDGKDISSEVVISGIEPNKPGYYDMTYTITKGSQVKSVNRKVAISKRNYTYEDKVRIRERAYLSVLKRESVLDLGEPILGDNAMEVVQFFKTKPVINDFLSGGIKWQGAYENGVLYAKEFVPTYRESYLNLSDEQYKEYYKALVNGPRAIVQSKIDASMTDYEKIKVLHDYIVNITVYDMENLNAGTIPFESYSALGVLVKGIAVCEGYMEAYQLLLNEAGIENKLVIGTATNSSGNSGGHGWNLVKLDGKWYHVDTTWDDPYVVGANRLRYTYFLKSDTFMKKNHTWTQGDLPYATEDYTIK